MIEYLGHKFINRQDVRRGFFAVIISNYICEICGIKVLFDCNFNSWSHYDKEINNIDYNMVKIPLEITCEEKQIKNILE